MSAPSIIFEEGPPTVNDQLVNVFCDGRRAGTLAFSKVVWDIIKNRGHVEVYCATKFEMGANHERA